MKYIFKKYEFTDEATAQARIDALPHQEDEDGNSHPSHSHTVVKLGNVVVTDGTYDDEGNELTAPVLANNYSVDVLWNSTELIVDGEVSYPYGWVSKEISVEGNGVHTFLGRNF